MGVRFVIGRAGTGKTSRCRRAIADCVRAEPLGPPIYWVLPKQATFTAERELTCAAGLDGFTRARVVSFELLGEDVLNDCGGAAVPHVTAHGRQMVLGHLLRKHEAELKFFKSVAKQAGLATELDATFAEIERSGRGAAELADLVRDLESSAGSDAHALALAAKFHDIHLLYDAYSKYLGQERLDPHRRLAEVLACVENCRLLQQADVYVDGFLEFSEFERRMLARIAKVCRRMEVALLLDPKSQVIADPHVMPADLSLFHKTEHTYKHLWFTFNEDGVEIGDPVLLTEPSRFTDASLKHAERCLFASRTSPARQSRGIALLEAPDRRMEADAAARHVRSLLRQGARLRDIAVLMRDLSSYHELIDASFREHGIPYFVDRRRAAAHHPLPQLIRAAFLIAHHRWPHDAVMTVLKSGLCGLSLSDADELENYVLLHRVKGDAWADAKPWPYLRTNLTRNADGDDDLAPAEQFERERIDALRRTLVEPFRPLVIAVASSETVTIRKIVSALYALLEQLSVRKTLHAWMKEAESSNDLEQRDEHAQVWTETAALFDQMVDLMGDEPVALADFLAILETGFEQLDLALTPPTVDQVLVGAVDRTRTPDVKHAVLLGLNEGEFPRVPRDVSILSDGERRTLKKRRINVDPDGERRLLDEQLYGYIAFTRAAESILITRPTSDDAARPTGPSQFWRRVRETFPDVEPQRIRREEIGRPELIGTPRQLVTSLMRWVRKADSLTPSPGTPGEGGGGGQTTQARRAGPHPDPPREYPGRETGADNTWLALYHWLATHVGCSDAIDVMRFRAWPALSYDNRAALSPDVARQLFRSPLHASVSRIESFATCPFKHFASYGLRLHEREDENVTALDLGNVYHSILERLVGQMLKSRADWGDVTDAQIKTYAKEVGQQLRGELMLSSPRNQYLLQRIEKTLNQVVSAQNACGKRGGFKPKWVELEFGRTDDGLPALQMSTPGGHEVQLHGKIDRVDLLEEQAAFAVIDYKLRGNMLSLDQVYHGISLQLITYLLVLQANGEQLAGRKLTPAAAFYVKLLRQLEDVKHPADATEVTDPAFDLKVKPRGVLDLAYLGAIDQQCADKSDVVNVRLKKDGTLGWKGTSDAAESSEFAALMRHVAWRIGQLADEIVAGRIDIAPFRLNDLTPCPRCDFRSVCRFELPVNTYHHLTVLGREQVLAQLTQQGAGDDA